MSELLRFPVRGSEAEYIQRGREAFATLFPGQEFSSHIWDLTPLVKRRHKKSNARGYWTVRGSMTDPLPPRFADPIKAACILDMQSKSNLIFRIDTARMLWDALRERLDGDAFLWEGVTSEDMLRMEQKMREMWAASTTYKMCSAWSRIIELLEAARVIKPMHVRWTTPRPEDSERFTLDGQEERMKLLPSNAALEAVADIYRTHAQEPSDRLISCVLAILNATALRIGEVLTLPYRCLRVHRPKRDAPRQWSLVYWVEKNKKRSLATLGLTDLQAELVRTAVREARAITTSARHRASVLEQSPGRHPLPKTQGTVTNTELAKWMGVDRGGISSIPPNRLPRVPTDDGSICFRVEDVEVYLANRQGPLWALRGGGATQALSDSLFVVNTNFFHRSRPTIPLLVELVTEQTVNDFLGGRWANASPDHPEAVQRDGKWMRPIIRSAFDRFGLTEEDGSPIELTTHQFRHWLTTQVAAGGVPDPVIARWQNRSHRADVGAYKHLTKQQRVEILRSAIVAGRVKGEIADMYFALVEDVRDVYLEEQLQHVHVTDLGLCVHDFSVSPCPHHLNCLKGCSDYVHDTSDELQRQQLVQLTVRTKRVLEEEKRQAAETGEAISESWIAENETVIRNAERTLAANPSDGTPFVQPFADEKSRFQPLEAE